MACRSVFSWRMRVASSESGRIMACSPAVQVSAGQAGPHGVLRLCFSSKLLLASLPVFFLLKKRAEIQGFHADGQRRDTWSVRVVNCSQTARPLPQTLRTARGLQPLTDAEEHGG